MAASNEQHRNTYATVAGMINGAAEVMQRIAPEGTTVRSWNELTPREQQQMAAALHKILTPIAVILSGRPQDSNGVDLGG